MFLIFLRQPEVNKRTCVWSSMSDSFITTLQKQTRLHYSSPLNLCISVCQQEIRLHNLLMNSSVTLHICSVYFFYDNSWPHGAIGECWTNLCLKVKDNRYFPARLAPRMSVPKPHSTDEDGVVAARGKWLATDFTATPRIPITRYCNPKSCSTSILS